MVDVMMEHSIKYKPILVHTFEVGVIIFLH